MTPAPVIADHAPAIHPTARIEDGVRIGAETTIWDHVHIRHSTQIGEQCIVGEKTYIAYGVHIGNRVKINAFVYICTAVTVEDGVMISAGVVFTNDRYPRATTPDLKWLRSSGPDEHTLPTLVREGATIGAASTIGCNLVIGRFAMVGMGSLVTKSVPDFALVVGNPARTVGYVCRCGNPLMQTNGEPLPDSGDLGCAACALRYRLSQGVVSERDTVI
jgi:UDP-2-acetamido-3-amino-2,3-dideoxy-glucuronate N-acetyltransferase